MPPRGYRKAALQGQKKLVTRMREEFGAGDENEALRMALTAMMEGYDRTMGVLPAETMARRLVDGSFCKAPSMARALLGMY